MLKLKIKSKNPLTTIIIIRIIIPARNKIVKIKRNILIETLKTKITVTTPTIPNTLIARNIITIIYKLIEIILSIIIIIYRIIVMLIVITAIVRKNATPLTRIKATI